MTDEKRKGEEKEFFNSWSVLAPDDKLQQDLSNLSSGGMHLANVFYLVVLNQIHPFQLLNI